MNEPLVSVGVVTYNSETTIIETLDSIYNQTYKNIELVISDDCSKDNTVGVCQKWIEQHKERFVKVQLLTVEKNTGTVKNYKRLVNAFSGEWVKDFDGDDVMLPNCIETFVNYITENPKTIYVFAKIKCIDGTQQRRDFMTNFFNYDFFNWDTKRQYDYLTLQRNCIPSQTNFYNLKKIKELGIEYDERIPLIEDWPRWIVVTKMGIKIHFIDEVLAFYRMSDNSICTHETQSAVYLKSYAKVYKYYGFPNEFKNYGKLTAICRLCNAEIDISDNKRIWRLLSKFAQKLLKFRNALRKL